MMIKINPHDHYPWSDTNHSEEQWEKQLKPNAYINSIQDQK